MKAKAKANLMVDEALIKRICDYSSLGKTESVLEIGAGTGNLTAELLSRAGRVYAIEKDPGFVEKLRGRFALQKNLEIISGNALKTDFPPTDKIASNLPYDISKKITEKILQQDYSIAVLVYQKEFAVKLSAKPGSENYRYISALTQSFAKIEVLETISPAAFAPQPKVNSAIVRLRQIRKLDEGYMLFLRKLFNQRKKKVKKLVDYDVDPQIGEKRPFQLAPEELALIYYH
jgi:16S rRNA (adenine1518-N6/adenine1519-N6)-dimethyltransferase